MTFVVREKIKIFSSTGNRKYESVGSCLELNSNGTRSEQESGS